MASARKKQDEKNLKILRELVSLNPNKYCFDCGQRGPTYVNVTIGSFVCTKCSGMLRGLTPPHRVKSISMATFTTEEVELVKQRGNEYCQRTWLGLYEQKLPQTTKDDQEIKDFMIDKYERKRYYLDPSSSLQNGKLSSPSVPKNNIHLQEVKPVRSSIMMNGYHKNEIKNSFRPKINGDISSLSNGIQGSNSLNSNGSDFADFNNADFFSATQFNNNQTQQFNNNNKINNINNANGTTQNTTQASFANFDNNPNIFNATTYNNSYENVYDSYLNQMNQLSSYFQTQWTAPVPTFNNTTNSVPTMAVNALPPPSADKYAAIKDIDNEQKMKQKDTAIDWSSGSSNASSFASSPQSTGSLFASPASTGNGFSSPSQGQFMSAFQQQPEPTNISNPFQNGSSPWGASNGNTQVVGNNFQAFGANPFRADNFNGISNKFTNGMSNGFQNGNVQMNTHIQPSPFQQQNNLFSSSQPSFPNNKPWNTPNPFAVGVTPTNGTHSNNPFL